LVFASILGGTPQTHGIEISDERLAAAQRYGEENGKEKRILERWFEGEKYSQAYIDYIAQKRA